MTDTTLPPPMTINPITRTWMRISPSLVPVFAVITALIMGIPFMIATGAQGDLGRGVNIAGTAYSALIEGATGLVINDIASRDDFDQLLALSRAEGGDLTRGDLRSLAQGAERVVSLDAENVRRYVDTLALFSDLSDDDLTDLAESVADINTIGTETLTAVQPLLTALDSLERDQVRDLAESLAGKESLTPEERTEIAAQLPVIDDYAEADFLAYMGFVNEYGIVRLTRLSERAVILQESGASEDQLADLEAMATVEGGVEAAREATAVIARFDAAGILNPTALSEQISVIREMYSRDLLTNDDVEAAIQTEFDTLLANNLVVRRPGNRLVIDRSSRAAGIIYGDNNTADEPSDDVPETAYLRLGGSALMFFPENLETMLVRSIPFVIAGLAVALGFKAGLFNIGAEGQLYAGAVLGVWVGFSPIFDPLPAAIRLPLLLAVGILGGALWGAIPGALKAYTGAHEVITTIMLNYVALRLVDWMIKSTNPIILLDPSASTPRTPFINPAAEIPPFTNFPTLIYLLAGVVVFLWLFWGRRAAIQRNPAMLIRPLVYGVLTAVGGLFLTWVGARGSLHIGFVIMIISVYLTDWFLTRTTLGFELRTVGENPDAAKYAGMNVKRNIILAMAISGALAGLAGSIEVSRFGFLQPDFFSGLGFDGIAVALLARKNPRSMIFAGLLWGSMLTGAGLMQLRADIAIDLVRVIQALIIMFIAADVIIRYLWRVPAPSDKQVGTFSKGWGG